MKKTDDILIQFGKQVKKIRLEKGISSQMKLAEKTSLDRTYIGDIERGKRKVALKSIQKVAKGLNVPLSELFDF